MPDVAIRSGYQAWVLQCYLHLTLVVICDKEFGFKLEAFPEGGVFLHESRNGVAVLITVGSEMGGEYWRPPTEFRLGKNS